MSKLDAKIPEGPLAEKWSKYKATQKLVSPNNRKKLDIIVVGTGIAGAFSEWAAISDKPFYVAETGISLRGDVRLAAELKPCGEDIILTGSLTIPFEMVCSRCLKSYKVNTLVELEGIFRAKIEGEEVEEMLDESSPDISFYESGKVDILPIIRDNIYLSIPMKPLCSEDCQGACPNCGADRNGKGYNYVSEDIDPRLEVLKGLRNKI